MTLSIHQLRVQDWRQAFRPSDFSRGRDYALDNRAQVEGLDKGVRDVPTFFINDELYEGRASFEGMKKAIAEVIRLQKTPARKRA